MLLDVRERGSLRRARDDARRRRRRGVRQGRAAARPRLSGRRRDRPARPRGRPGRVRLPRRARPGARLLVLRREDRAPLRGPRPGPTTSSSARRADLAACYQRAIVRALVERTREAAEQVATGRIAVVGGVAANSELRAALPEAALRAARALHRQRGDDRLRGPLSTSRLDPGYLGLDAYASSREPRATAPLGAPRVAGAAVVLVLAGGGGAGRARRRAASAAAAWSGLVGGPRPRSRSASA